MKKDETTLVLKKEAHTSGGDIRPGDEGSDWPSYEDSYIETTFGDLFMYSDISSFGLSPQVGFWGEFIYNVKEDLLNSSLLYVVIVIYSTGDTFSHTTGETFVEGVYGTYEEAKEVSRKIKEGEYGDGKDLYLPWTGYFEDLEDVLIHPAQLFKKGKL